MTVKPIELFVPFTQILRRDDDTLVVEGYAFVNEVVPGQRPLLRSAMETATPDYMRWGAVREMHQPIAAGNALEVEWDEKGCRVRSECVDVHAQRKIEKGVYKGYSVGVNPLTVNRLGAVDTCEWVETSYVDRPKDPDATFLYRVGEWDPEAEIEVPEPEGEALSTEGASAGESETERAARIIREWEAAPLSPSPALERSRVTDDETTSETPLDETPAPSSEEGVEGTAPPEFTLETASNREDAPENGGAATESLAGESADPSAVARVEDVVQNLSGTITGVVSIGTSTRVEDTPALRGVTSDMEAFPTRENLEGRPKPRGFKQIQKEKSAARYMDEIMRGFDAYLESCSTIMGSDAKDKEALLRDSTMEYGEFVASMCTAAEKRGDLDVLLERFQAAPAAIQARGGDPADPGTRRPFTAPEAGMPTEDGPVIRPKGDGTFCLYAPYGEFLGEFPTEAEARARWEEIVAIMAGEPTPPLGGSNPPQPEELNQKRSDGRPARGDDSVLRRLTRLYDEDLLTRVAGLNAEVTRLQTDLEDRDRRVEAQNRRILQLESEPAMPVIRYPHALERTIIAQLGQQGDRQVSEMEAEVEFIERSLKEETDQDKKTSGVTRMLMLKGMIAERRVRA